MSDNVDVAVVGMGCMFPGAPDLRTFWTNIEKGVDATATISSNRTDAVFFDAESQDVDRIYCRRGGFLPDLVDFDAAGFGIMPVAAMGAEPDQLLTLEVASRCLADAGYDERPFNRDRAGIIVGRGGYLTPGLVRLNQKIRGAQQLVEVLREILPGVPEDKLAEIKEEFQEKAGVFGPDTAVGLVPNLVASRVANRLDLHGPAYTLDAACASSLLAVDHAVRELRSGRCDLVLAGGAHVCQDLSLWAVFCQLGAMSRQGAIRPFDRRADGLLIGEGVGLVALKRTDDALADGDRIYARIRGVGVSSDGRSASLFSPRVEGQVLALRRAWKEAGADPHSVDLIEAHGTATLAGDEAELQTLREVFGDSGSPVVLGSVKANIGHTMPTAGIAGLIKATLAIHHGVLPPSINCEEPREGLNASRFRVLKQAEPWTQAELRRAGVNAFGFGGINAHVVLENHGEAHRLRRIAPLNQDELEVLTLAAPDVDTLIQALDDGKQCGGEGHCRLVILDPTADRVRMARRIARKNKVWKGRHGIWFSPRALAHNGGRIAFLFPGVEAVFEPEVDTLVRRFRERPPTYSRPRNLEETGRGVVSLGLFLHRILTRLGVKPEAYAGHSVGEWTGMLASGIWPEDEVYRLINSLKPGSLEVPGLLFAAAGCSWDKATRAIEGLSEISISHDNCPHQVILCGQTRSIEIARERLIESGVICQVLPFKSGFHSPLFEPYLDWHRKHFEALPINPPTLPMWSATTASPYPDADDEVRQLAADHLVKPLRFRELVERLYEEGFRIFVQIGTGSVVGFIEDTLKGRHHIAVSSSEPSRSGLVQIRNLALALYSEGVAVKLDDFVRQSPERRPVRLRLGTPLVHMESDTALTWSGENARVQGASSPVMAEFEALQNSLDRAGADVLSALTQQSPQGAADSWTRTRTLSVFTVPELRDHSFFPQPKGWPVVSDGYPVVPMTCTVLWMLEAASKVGRGQVPIALQNLEAYKWLRVDPEVEVVFRAERISEDAVEVVVEGYARALVLLGDDYPPAPPAGDRRIENARAAPIKARDLYDDGWMFHGPLYQGVVDLQELGDDGVRGILETGRAPGALLDNAGQLFGFWVMATQERDKLAMPVRIERMEFFGSHPEVGSQLECGVKILRLDDVEVEADLELSREGTVWCRIHGWTDRRFESDERMWNVMRHSERNILSERQPEGWFLYDDSLQRAPKRDWLMRRHLGEHERREMLAAGPRRQRLYLHGRIAAKDAVRSLVWDQGGGPIFPVELRIRNDVQGRPHVEGFKERDLRVSIAHCDDIAVAMVGEGKDVGIDVMLIEERDPDYVESIIAEVERPILHAYLDEFGEHIRSEALTRAWCAKEAVSKSRGLRLVENPRAIVVEKRLGEDFLVDGVWTRSRKIGSYVVAWIIE